jgi:hypothetical protein
MLQRQLSHLNMLCRVAYIAFRYSIFISLIVGIFVLTSRDKSHFFSDLLPNNGCPCTAGIEIVCHHGNVFLIFVVAETGAQKPFPSNGYARYNIIPSVSVRRF